MTEKRFYVVESNLIDGYCVFDREKEYVFHPRPRKADCLNDAHTLNELHEENKSLKNKLDNELNERIEEIEHLKQFLKQSYDELKYFTGLFEDNEIDVTVKELLRNLDLILDNDNMSLPSFFNYLINENEQLKQEHDELKDKLKR